MAARRPLIRQDGQLRQMPSGDTVPVAAGGTGATTPEQARDNLGVGTLGEQDATDVHIQGGLIEETVVDGGFF